MLYYLYTVKMGQSEDGFFRSTLPKVVYLVEQWGNEKKIEAAAMSGKPIPEPPRTVRSIKEVLKGYGI